jgi:hypothetical protein
MTDRRAICSRHGQGYALGSTCPYCEPVVTPLADTLPRAEATPLEPVDLYTMDWPFNFWAPVET